MQLLALDPEYVPTAHWVHAVDPAAEYVPLRHVSHLVSRPSVVDAVPSSQLMQSVSVWLVQAVHPGRRLYLPAEHLMHGPPARTLARVSIFKLLTSNIAILRVFHPNKGPPIQIICLLTTKPRMKSTLRPSCSWGSDLAEMQRSVGGTL